MRKSIEVEQLENFVCFSLVCSEFDAKTQFFTY